LLVQVLLLVEDHLPVNIAVLLGLAWLAFAARYGVQFFANRRENAGSLPGLPPLPERSSMATKAALYAGRPVLQRGRSRAAQRRLVVLQAISLTTMMSFVVGVFTGAPGAWWLFVVSTVALVAYVRALVVRRNARRQQYVERLWTKGRYDDLGHARVMSLEEARQRANQIADPVYVPARPTQLARRIS
jgi:hypothetical protein